MPVRHASASAGYTCDPMWSIGAACAGPNDARRRPERRHDDVSSTHSLRKARAPHGTRCLRCSLAGDRGTRPPGRRRTPWCVLLPFTALRTPPRTLGLAPTACVAQHPTPAARAHALPRCRAFTRDTTPPSPDLVPSFADTQDATAFAARHLLAYSKLVGYGSHNLGDKARARPASTHTPSHPNRPPNPTPFLRCRVSPSTAPLTRLRLSCSSAERPRRRGACRDRHFRGHRPAARLLLPQGLVRAQAATQAGVMNVCVPDTSVTCAARVGRPAARLRSVLQRLTTRGGRRRGAPLRRGWRIGKKASALTWRLPAWRCGRRWLRKLCKPLRNAPWTGMPLAHPHQLLRPSAGAVAPRRQRR